MPWSMSTKPITLALARVERGEEGASEELWALVYEDLRQLAASRLRALEPGQTLQATALVNEAWIRLSAGKPSEWEGRAHFFGAAARSMRNILVDAARRKQALKRNAGQQPRSLDAEIVADDTTPHVDILALDEALNALTRDFDRPARIVMLRFFAGLTIPKIAEVLDVASRTVDREYRFARTWLRRFLDAPA